LRGGGTTILDRAFLEGEQPIDFSHVRPEGGAHLLPFHPFAGSFYQGCLVNVQGRGIVDDGPCEEVQGLKE
jgi:hypothetical protein